MNWTIRKMKNASVARSFGTISGQNVLIQPSWGNSMYCGTITTWIGSMIVPSMIANQTRLNAELQPGERVGGQRAGQQVARRSTPATTISELMM